MIEYIKGKVVEKNPAYVVIETTGGLAYFIHISLATFSSIQNMEEVKILTHYVIREDAQLLFGFYEEEERNLFRLLISVNGIGVNTARLMLSSLSVNELINGIATENIKLIQSIKGIGAKTAQRVVIELKDKIGKTTIPNTENFAFNYNNNKAEALSALVSLGFVKNSADTVLEKIIKSEGINLSVEDLIKKALKLL
ncbi:MAG TPA: Holliday junction branch migration protein RuvA [Bacteroidales bacterium]|jgi:Holliday junction DNA helicase RuvA|nr:Holliday junction branch migration protein RuvA [Bacteroidales bacterium]